MPIKMRFERTDSFRKIALFCDLECREQCIRDLCHRRYDDYRVPVQLRRDNMKNALKRRDIADGSPAKFHYGWMKKFAHKRGFCHE